MKTLEQIEQTKFQKGFLVPACGGTEKPFTMRGYNLLYVYHTGNGNHYYHNLDTDLLLCQSEVNKIFFEL